MNSFVQNAYPSKHLGVVRIARAANGLQHIATTTDRQRGAVSLLLAVLVSALLVVMHPLVTTWNDGLLLAAWMGLWLALLMGMVLFALPARRALQTLRSAYQAWGESRHQDEEEERTRAVALQDARVMADLVRIMEANAPASVGRRS